MLGDELWCHGAQRNDSALQPSQSGLVYSVLCNRNSFCIKTAVFKYIFNCLIYTSSSTQLKVLRSTSLVTPFFFLSACLLLLWFSNMGVDKCKLPSYVAADPLTWIRAVEACFHVHSVRRDAD